MRTVPWSLRLLLWLVLANLLFFAWWQGHLGSWPTPPALRDREPERRALQLRPEQVSVLAAPSPAEPPPAAAASAPVLGEGSAPVAGAEAALAAAEGASGAAAEEPTRARRRR